MTDEKKEKMTALIPSVGADGTGTVLFVSLESINLSILLHAAQRH